MRATQPRVPVGPLGGGGATRWNLAGLGHIDHRKVVVDRRPHRLGRRRRDRGPLPGRPLPRPLPPAWRDPSSPSCSSSSWPGSAGSAALSPAAELDALFPALEDGETPATVLHNAPGRYRPITTEIARLLDGAHETLDVVNPYVTDRRHDPAHRAGRPPRGPRPPLRPGEREQLGLRRRAALPPRRTPGRRRPHSRVPGDAAREGVRPRRRGACSPERATSRRGASSASSRSTSSCGHRRWRRSSTSGSASRRSSPRRPGGASRERRSGPARRHSRSCRRCSDPPGSPVWAVRGWGAARGEPAMSDTRAWAPTKSDRLHRPRTAARPGTARRTRSGLPGRSRCSPALFPSRARCRGTGCRAPAATSSPD